LHAQAPALERGELRQGVGGSLSFELLIPNPLDPQRPRLRLELYTFPSAVEHFRGSLREADALLFVADSAFNKREANLSAFTSLDINLKALGLKNLPRVLVWNKRDLRGTLPLDDLIESLNPLGLPAFEVVALNGRGLFQAFGALSWFLAQELEGLEGRSTQASAMELPGSAPQMPAPSGSAPQAPPPPISVPETLSIESPVELEYPEMEEDLDKSPPPPPLKPAPRPAASKAKAAKRSLTERERLRKAPSARKKAEERSAIQPAPAAQDSLKAIFEQKTSEVPSAPQPQAKEQAKQAPEPEEFYGKLSDDEMGATQESIEGLSTEEAVLEEQEALIESFERSATVRYFEKMYPHHNYPLMVILSQRKIQEILIKRVAQVSSQQRLSIKQDNPILHIRPIVPGCLIHPSEQSLDVTPKLAQARFWITPLILGKIEEASVEISYEGRVIDRISIPIRVGKQTMAKLSALSSAATPGLKYLLKTSMGSKLKIQASSAAPALVSWMMERGSYLLGGGLALLSLLLYLWKRPRAAKPVESFFDFDVEDEKEGSWFIKDLKTKLLLFHPQPRWLQLSEFKTLLGQGEMADIQIQGLAPLHAQIDYNQEQGFSLFPFETTQLEGGEISARSALGREAQIQLGTQHLWFYDERPDARLDARSCRKRVMKALIKLSSSKEAQIRDTFAAGKQVPLRRVVSNLMLAQSISLDHWRQVRERLKLPN